MEEEDIYEVFTNLEDAMAFATDLMRAYDDIEVEVYFDGNDYIVEAVLNAW